MRANDTNHKDLEHALQRILWELRAYLPEIVIIGGWVPYLYREYGPIPWGTRLSLTAEVDMLISRELPPRGRQPVVDILAAAGFRSGNSDEPSAVWANDPERGEKVEFMVPHEGPFEELQTVVPIRRQAGLGGISLMSLEVMQRHIRTITVPTVSADGLRSTVDVRVPQLGAYVLNKGAVFMRRNAEIAPEKRVKDLLYLRDLMVAGQAIVDVIVGDVATILRDDPKTQHLLDTAVGHLDRATRTDPDLLDRAGDMLGERDGVSRGAARADMKGHPLDLLDSLSQFRSPDPAVLDED